MSVLVSVPLREGGSVVFEVPDDLASAGVVRAAAARPGEVVKEAGETFEDALDRTLVPLARALMGRLKEIEPDEAEVTLGIKLSAEAGVVISKVAGEGSVSVTLTWQRAKQ